MGDHYSPQFLVCYCSKKNVTCLQWLSVLVLPFLHSSLLRIIARCLVLYYFLAALCSMRVRHAFDNMSHRCVAVLVFIKKCSRLIYTLHCLRSICCLNNILALQISTLKYWYQYTVLILCFKLRTATTIATLAMQ